MGLLATTSSITRYQVNGHLKEPILETIASGLKKFAIRDIDGQPSEQTAGWTDLKSPYSPDSIELNFSMGVALVFALRLDKKSVPSKLLNKHFAAECAKRLKGSERDYLSSNEKQLIKDHIQNKLNIRMPATPNVYDVVWHYEQGSLWFFSNLKRANEELETLFSKSFQLSLIRRIPFTMATDAPDLNDHQRDLLLNLSP
jgi:DNA recombination-dependent growth factor C